MNEEALFAAALDKPDEAQRQAFLDEACGGDVCLRQRVEKLLAADRHSRGILERGAVAAHRHEPFATEQVFADRFLLREKLGEGGMGEVWVADQIEPVRRRVALKVIRPGLATARLLARFETECQALALMDHPNIARVLDAGVANERPFFVMELIEGVPITQYCDQAGLSTSERLQLFVAVAQAVQHAHQKGIIHRDLKPSNILVAQFDGKPVPKVIDFGLAKATGQFASSPTISTEIGVVLGTPEYMSPEQADPHCLDVDTRSDIYSLGVLLYELLTGSVPFSRTDLQAVPFAEMLRIIREVEPPAPSVRLVEAETLPGAAPVRRARGKARISQLRGELDWIVMKCLEKDRNRRYETANALALDLQRYLANEPVAACPPSNWYRLRRFVRRNKGRLVMAAGALLALTVMAGSIGWAVRDRAARVAATEQAEIARRATVERQVRDLLITARTLIAENKLAAARASLTKARAQLEDHSSALKNLSRDIEAGEADLERFQQFLDLIDRGHQAETAPPRDPTSGAVGERRPAAAIPFLLDALNCYEIMEVDEWTSTLEGCLLGTQQVKQIRLIAYEELVWLADDLVRRQREHRSERKLSPEAAARAALVYLDKARSAHRPTPALHAVRTRCYKILGDEVAAQADAELADKTPPTMALDYYLRGQAAYDAKKMTEGLQAFESALRVDATHYWSMMKLGYCLCDLGQRPEDFAGAARVFTGCILKRPEHAHAYYCRANAYSRLHRHEEVLADSSRAIELDPKYAVAWYVRGVSYNELGKPDRALADFTRAIELDPTLAMAWNNRGFTNHKLGQPEKAIADFNRAIELDPNYAPAWSNRGTTYREMGQPEKAIADCSRAIELDAKFALAWNGRGAAYHQLGQLDRALADFNRAIELDPKSPSAWSNRGNTYNDLGQPDRAIADCSRAIELDPKYATAWRNRGAAHNKLRQLDRAVADFTRAIELNPKHPLAWHSRGATYTQLGQPDKAIADFTRAIALDSKHPLVWYNRGVTHQALDQPDRAIADFTKAIELAPKFAVAWTNRGALYHKLGQSDRAVADFTRVIELDPKSAPAWNNRALVYFQMGQYDRAVADTSRAIALAPKHPQQWTQAYLLRAQAHSRIGRFEQARTDYQTVLERMPNHAWTLNALAWLLATCPETTLRDPVRAVESARKAVELAPKSGSYWKTLGVAHYRAGNEKAAVTALEKSVELGQGTDAVDRFFLAMALRKLGKHDEARKAYDQAIAWLEKNKETLAKDRGQSKELRCFHAEAEEVLELKKN